MPKKLQSVKILNKKHSEKPLCLPNFLRNPKKSNTHKEDYLAILTSASEGTVRQLAESPQVNIKVRGELRSSHNTVQRQERLCATKCS